MTVPVTDKKETCIMCNGETPYTFNTPISNRFWYVEGAGQCCKECYNNI